jgi:hypothetical protein
MYFHFCGYWGKKNIKEEARKKRLSMNGRRFRNLESNSSQHPKYWLVRSLLKSADGLCPDYKTN